MGPWDNSTSAGLRLKAECATLSELLSHLLLVLSAKSMSAGEVSALLAASSVLCTVRLQLGLGVFAGELMAAGEPDVVALRCWHLPHSGVSVLCCLSDFLAED